MLFLLGHGLDRIDLIYVLVVDELAFVAISAESWRLLMPLLAHFGLVVFVEALRRRLHDELAVAVSVGAVIIEFAIARIHEISAQLCLVIELEVLDVAQHLLSRLKMHLLLLSRLLAGQVVSHDSVPASVNPMLLVMSVQYCLLGIFYRHFFGVLLLYISPDVGPERVLNRGMIIATI